MNSNQFRKLINLFEARVPGLEYENEKDKVIVKLYSYNSQSYTKLAQKIERVKELEEQIKELKQDIVQSGRENVNDLFDAADAVNTRVVETVSFIFQLTKDPKPTVAPKYKDILEELSKHLTPELTVMLTQLKEKMVTTTQKAPALSMKRKDESISEGIGDKISGLFRAFKQHVLRWGKSYDQRLDQLKQEAQTV